MDEVCCIECQKSDDQVPLIKLLYKNHEYYVCTQHLPLFIHHPEELVGKLPDAENLQPYQ